MEPSPALAAIATIDHDTLFARMAADEVLVTANGRLARILTEQYNRWRMGRGDRHWPTARVFSWEDWLDHLWQLASIDSIPGTGTSLLGKRQALSLWERVLRADPAGGSLLPPESLAAQLDETRRLVVDWLLPRDDPAWGGEPDDNPPAFQRWNRAFESLCRQNRWLPPEDRSEVLARAIGEGTLAVDGPIRLLGFDEFKPAQQRVLDALASQGRVVCRCTITPHAGRAELLRCTEPRDELRRMARWVRHWFEQEPHCRIGIVVADLQSRRVEVERNLAEFLLPGRHRWPAQSRPWNASLGAPLARVPLIEAAFDVLGLMEHRIDIQQLARVLRSPWIAGGREERNSRGLLEKCLRERYPRQLKTGEIRYRAGESRAYGPDGRALPPEQQAPQPWHSPVLERQLRVVQHFERDHRKRRRPSQWAESIDRLLARLGWPQLDADRPDEQGEDWQAFQAWQEALGELASLDLTLTDLSRAQAFERLLQICRDRIFQPRSPAARIQVLGVYEASGLRFDHLWVLGLSNDNWPPAARPDPFIPGRLQRAAGLPHSSPERELDVACTVTRRLLQTSADCVFSYPGRVAGEEVLPSPLFLGDRFRHVGEVAAWTGASWPEAIHAAPGPDLIPLAPPTALRGEPARGGHSILKHQAQCPFRAFACNRLGAEGLEAPRDGISPRLHGDLLHRVLEGFWRETESQAALLALGPAGMAARVEGHVDSVLEAERSLRDRPQLRAVEARRLARLLLTLLELEMQREPFEVAGLEQQVLLEILGQAIRLYIDRVDRLAPGRTAIIDYKSGRVDPKKWFGDRPEDPQLPLYAISAADTPAAVVFAVVRDGDCHYRGVTNRAGLFPGLPPGRGRNSEQLVEAGADMGRTIRNWRETLERLMQSFLSGQATIDPKDGDRTCEDSFCDFRALCRVEELRQLDAGG